MATEQSAPLLYGLARAAAERWGLGEAELNLIQHEDNAVFRLTARGEGWVLRLGNPEGRTIEEQHSEMTWLVALRNDGLTVPRPVRDLTGSLVVDVASPGMSTRPCVLLEWIAGEPPGVGISTQALNGIGALTGRIHLQAERFRPALPFSRPDWNFDTLFGPDSVLRDSKVIAKLDLPSRRVVSQAIDGLRPKIGRDREGASMRGLIHGDLHRDNILVDAETIGFIDFDDCGYGSPLMDLAALLESLERRIARDPRDRERIHRAILEGYASCRALSADDERHIVHYVTVRLLIMLQFLLGSQNENVQSWAGEQVTAIVRRLAASQDH